MFFLVQKLDISPHLPAYPEDSVSGRICAYIFDQDFRTRNQQPCGYKIGGRGDVSRHDYFLTGKFRFRLDGNGGVLTGYTGAKRTEH